MVMIHGLGAMGVIQWPAELLELLVAAGLYIITFDNRDVGKSTLLSEMPAPSEILPSLMERFNDWLPPTVSIASFLLLAAAGRLQESNLPNTSAAAATLVAGMNGFRGTLLEAASFGLPDAPYSLDDMAEDTALLMDSLGLAEAHILGASMGGMVAQAFCNAYPHRALSLCSIMSCPGPGNGPYIPTMATYVTFFKTPGP